MKQSQTQSVSQLRQMLLDPAVNLVYQRLVRETDKLRENLKQTQNDLSAWKFTADRCLSNLGNFFLDTTPGPAGLLGLFWQVADWT